MSKIIGNTTATPNPRPDWNQNDPTKADYIKNKPFYKEEKSVILAEFNNFTENPDDPSGYGVMEIISNPIGLVDYNVYIVKCVLDTGIVTEGEAVAIEGNNGVWLSLNSSTQIYDATDYCMCLTTQGVASITVFEVKTIYHPIPQEYLDLTGMLPEELFVVNLTLAEDGTVTADKTFAEITEAYSLGKYVWAKGKNGDIDNIEFQLVFIGGPYIWFSCMGDKKSVVVEITSDNVCSLTATTLATEEYVDNAIALEKDNEFVVIVNINPSSIGADKTFEEIQEANNNGKKIKGYLTDDINDYNAELLYFIGANAIIFWEVKGNSIFGYHCDSNNVWFKTRMPLEDTTYKQIRISTMEIEENSYYYPTCQAVIDYVATELGEVETTLDTRVTQTEADIKELQENGGSSGESIMFVDIAEVFGDEETSYSFNKPFAEIRDWLMNGGYVIGRVGSGDICGRTYYATSWFIDAVYFSGFMDATSPTTSEYTTLFLHDDESVEIRNYTIMNKEGISATNTDFVNAVTDSLPTDLVTEDDLVTTAPYIGENGNWYELDKNTGEFVDTGVKAQGEGIVSVGIQDDGQLYVSYDGMNYNPVGKVVPQKGTDYWTEEDKAEIKAYVDEAILGGAW